MSAIGFFEPQYIDNPQTCTQKLQNFAEGYFDLKNSSLLETALKVISYATLIIPAIVLAIRTALRYLESAPKIGQVLTPEIQAVLDQTPEFAGYRIGQGTPYAGSTLTSATIRPANLFFRALLGDNSTTMPGSGELFAFRAPPEQIRAQITQADPHGIVAFSAAGTPGQTFSRTTGRRVDIPDLAALYGPATYRLSNQEIQSTLESQKIYTAPMLPLPFYRALKQAMIQDGIVTLPGNDGGPRKVNQLATPACVALLANVIDHFADYGFSSRVDCDRILNLTLYQLGSLVIKTEDYRIFLDGNGKIRERNPGAQDAIRLINACGIRGIHATPSPDNKTIMTQAFQVALRSAENGFVVFPAVGMGVWGGDPDLYWRAFLDAVIESGTPLEQIFVNPGHQTTRNGIFNGHNGNEFQLILDEYRTNAQRAQDTAAIANLAKVTNLFERKTDLVHLSHNLKVAFPDKTVSLFNASDPDVTLGNHVGEYVNNLDHATTTEENYTALGTNGLCFERITGVHDAPHRLIQL
jgi:hypothetical protein